MPLSDIYKRLVNGFRTNNGLAPLYPAPDAATPPAAPNPPLASEVVDADDDECSQDAEDAVELMRGVIKDINGEDEDANAGDDTGGDDEDEISQLGALALPVRRLLTAHYKAKFEVADAEQEKASAEAKRVQDAAAFMRAAAKATGVIKR